MKRVYANSQYAKPCERYCREVYPDEAAQIFKKAENYLDFLLFYTNLTSSITNSLTIC